MEKTIKTVKKGPGKTAAAAPAKPVAKSSKTSPSSAGKTAPGKSVTPAVKPAPSSAGKTAPGKSAAPAVKPAPSSAVKTATGKSAAPAAKSAPSSAGKTPASEAVAPVVRPATPSRKPASTAKPPAVPAKPRVAAAKPAAGLAKPTAKGAPGPADKPTAASAPRARLTLSSRNYSSWSLRGWLLTRFAGLECEEVSVAPDHPDRRAELLLLSPSILVPMLEHEGLRIWDVLAITEYLHERFPKAGLLPTDTHARARCRSICGEIHSGFSALRSALPMNLRMRQRQFKVWSRAQADIDRVFTIWSECLKEFGGPYLFGARSAADAMYAPVVTRLRTYDVAIPAELAGYCGTILAMPEMKEWEAAAAAEPDQLEEFDVEF